MSDHTILLSAGGTGGHLFPAEALAEELLRRGQRVVIVTDKRGHAFQSLSDKARIHTVRAATLKTGLRTKIKAVLEIGIGIVQSLLLLRRYRPSVVVGFGGYPSFPAVFAAQCLNIPTVLHEQNAVFGKANAFLAEKAAIIATSLPQTRGLPRARMEKVVLTGNPVRSGILKIRDCLYTPPGPDSDIRLLITGGSQGAAIFSRVIPLALRQLPAKLQSRLKIHQQCRSEDIPQVSDLYRTTPIDADLRPFFTDIENRLEACHLFIGRSGASTVAEIAVAGRPALFIPFQHKDMQQTHNAAALGSGAWILPQDHFSAEVLAQKLRELLENPDILSAIAKDARQQGQPHATQLLADLVEARITK